LLFTAGFTRLDPFFGNLNDPQSLHKYLYTHVDPVNGIDPSGMMSAMVVSVAIGIGVGITAMTVAKFGAGYSWSDSALIGLEVGLTAFLIFLPGGAAISSYTTAGKTLIRYSRLLGYGLAGTSTFFNSPLFFYGPTTANVINKGFLGKLDEKLNGKPKEKIKKAKESLYTLMTITTMTPTYYSLFDMGLFMISSNTGLFEWEAPSPCYE
jgi:hypothetical protein